MSCKAVKYNSYVILKSTERKAKKKKKKKNLTKKVSLTKPYIVPELKKCPYIKSNTCACHRNYKWGMCVPTSCKDIKKKKKTNKQTNTCTHSFSLVITSRHALIYSYTPSFFRGLSHVP